MKNVVFSTRNIDDFISDVADEVVKKMELRNVQPQLPSETSDPKYDVKDTANYLKITIPTVYSKHSRGELPGCKAPGSKRVFFFKSDLDAILRQGGKKTNSVIEGEAEKYLIKKKGLKHG